MGITNQELLQKLFEKQSAMQKLYDTKTTIGKLLEIPRVDESPVKVLLNYPTQKTEEPLPVFLNMHGGAFIEGDALTMDSYCQKLADRLGILVVNVNYKLFPEKAFPYQIEEIEAVKEYLILHQDEMGIDGKRIGLGGFSAGATLSLGVVIKSIQEGTGGYRCCVLGYPMTSALMEDQDKDSDFPVGNEEMVQAMNLFTNGEEKNPRVSARYAEKEILEQMKGVVIFSCGKDSLGKQGKEFAEKLVSYGVPVFFKEYKEAYHGFLEVNRPDYFPEDPRKNEEQLGFTKDAEELIISGLKYML